MIFFLQFSFYIHDWQKFILFKFLGLFYTSFKLKYLLKPGLKNYFISIFVYDVIFKKIIIARTSIGGGLWLIPARTFIRV